MVRTKRLKRRSPIRRGGPSAKAAGKAFSQALHGKYVLLDKSSKPDHPVYMADPLRVRPEPPVTTAPDKAKTFVDRSGVSKLFRRQPQLKGRFTPKHVM